MARYEVSTAVRNDARALLRRMLDMRQRDGLEICIQILAFWMWLESCQGFQEILRKIHSQDDTFLGRVSCEAEAVLSHLKSRSEIPFSPSLMSTTLPLADRFLSLRVIFSDKEKALNVIVDIVKQVCPVLFKDILEERGVDYGGLGFPGSVHDSNSTGPEHHGTVPCLGRSKLNPSAKEWNPTIDRPSEENRCLFLTFSNGYPLSENQIISFFTEKYGPCVERVYVHWQEGKKPKPPPPLFGKVVFKASYIPAVILGGENKAKFHVDGKPLWCKRFDPLRKKGN